MKFKDAVRHEKLSYIEVLQKGLQVMDATAVSLCMDHRMPIVVFDMTATGNIKKAVMGDLSLGTVVS